MTAERGVGRAVHRCLGMSTVCHTLRSRLAGSPSGSLPGGLRSPVKQGITASGAHRAEVTFCHCIQQGRLMARGHCLLSVIVVVWGCHKKGFSGFLLCYTPYIYIFLFFPTTLLLAVFESQLASIKVPGMLSSLLSVRILFPNHLIDLYTIRIQA